jgi:hypothetical protein
MIWQTDPFKIRFPLSRKTTARGFRTKTRGEPSPWIGFGFEGVGKRLEMTAEM